MELFRQEVNNRKTWQILIIFLDNMWQLSQLFMYLFQPDFWKTTDAKGFIISEVILLSSLTVKSCTSCSFKTIVSQSLADPECTSWSLPDHFLITAPLIPTFFTQRHPLALTLLYGTLGLLFFLLFVNARLYHIITLLFLISTFLKQKSEKSCVKWELVFNNVLCFSLTSPSQKRSGRVCLL